MKLAPLIDRVPSHVLLAICFLVSGFPIYAVDSYVEPGTLRISNQLSLEGIFHRLRPGWNVEESSDGNGRDKQYSTGSSTLEEPDDIEWGTQLLTELSARFSPSVTARGLFEIQEYADRFWRPLNAEHYYYEKGNPLFVREFEGQIHREEWYLRGFSGVAHGNWKDKGDFFGLYRDAIGDSDYLGSSGYFGVYPEQWKENVFHNLSLRRVPEGFEGGFELNGWSGTLMYGDELVWGYDQSFFGRLAIPIKKTSLTMIYMNDDVPSSFYGQDERRKAASLTWIVPFEAGHRIDVGLMYQPFRYGKSYIKADSTTAGSGTQGSSWNISEDIAKKEDGWAGRARLEGLAEVGSRYWVGVVDLTHAGILAGNKDEIGLELGTDILPTLKWQSAFTARKPIEGPVPFLYEGSAGNIGNIVANPRGPESPFTVDWTNREAKILLSTFWFDPTPTTNMFQYDPTALQNWNINPEEDAPMGLALQHRMSDYPTAIDRQYYYDSSGDIVWESAGYPGAWASEHPLHEFRLLGTGQCDPFQWTLGIAGGQTMAYLGVAYQQDSASNKGVTEYFSVEAKLDFEKWGVWGHYGTGLWGPEPNIDPWFGNSFDRVFGIGTKYNFTPYTSWDVSYLGTRQDDDLFMAPTLGSFDEVRMTLTHKFGFLLHFHQPLKPGSLVP